MKHHALPRLALLVLACLSLPAQSPFATVTPASLQLQYWQGETAKLQSTLRLSGPSSAGFRATSNAAWLSLSPSIGTLPASIQVTAKPAGLAPGNYSAEITIQRTDAAAQSASVAVAFQITVPIVLEARPSESVYQWQPGAALPAARRVMLTSSQPIRYQAESTEPWVRVEPTAGLAPGPLMLSVNPQGLPSGTHSAQIRFQGEAGEAVAAPLLVSLQIASSSQPTIVDGGVTHAYSGEATIAPGSLVRISGDNLAGSPARVTFNDAAATVVAADLKGLLVAAPANLPKGLAQVRVETSQGVAESTVQCAAFAPGIALDDETTRMVLALRGDYSLAGTDPALPLQRPTRPGEEIIIEGSGFGILPTRCTASDPCKADEFPSVLEILLGGQPAPLQRWWVDSPGTVRFRILVPTVDPGKRTVRLLLEGTATAEDLWIQVGP
jgi:uncharacterized protein (TIGR03437 family)